MDESNVNWIEDLKVVSLKAGDTLVIKAKFMLSENERQHIQKAIEKIFPGHKFIILDASVDLGVISGDENT